MGKEIERKWLYNFKDLDVEDIEQYLNGIGTYIADYYFNDFCRLRNKDDIWFITVKSEGDLVRDEFEFPISKSNIDFLPAPMLIKCRWNYKYKGHTYEINVFKDVYDKQGIPLITIELELPHVHEIVKELPIFCGKEITQDKEYYGYNLFKGLREYRYSNPFAMKINNVIPLDKFRKLC